MNVGLPLLFGFVIAIVALFVWLVRRANKQTAESLARNEALFASMFADLQPYFHPRNVLEFVRARLAQEPARSGMRVAHPPGLGVHAADVSFVAEKGKERELWRLIDEAGHEVSRFFFEADAKDGMVRVGPGKFRVARVGDRVRYWHPEREFKWTPPGLWKFSTPVFEHPVDSSDRGLTVSDTSSSSSSARTAAAAAGIVAAGGAFDGGGASAAWSEGGGASADSSSESSTATSY